MVKKSEKFSKNHFCPKIPIIRTTRFDQSSPVQPNSEKISLEKSLFFAKEKKNAISLVLPIEDISRRPELSSPSPFQNPVGAGGTVIVTDEQRTNKQTNGNPCV